MRMQVGISVCACAWIASIVLALSFSVCFSTAAVFFFFLVVVVVVVRLFFFPVPRVSVSFRFVFFVGFRALRSTPFGMDVPRGGVLGGKEEASDPHSGGVGSTR